MDHEVKLFELRNRLIQRLVLKVDSLPKSEPGEVVYFVAEKGSPIDAPLKIGFTNDITTRFRDLQCGNPRELELLAYFEAPPEAERIVHRAFAYLRLKTRNEWFKPDESLYRFMHAMCGTTYCTHRKNEVHPFGNRLLQETHAGLVVIGPT